MVFQVLDSHSDSRFMWSKLLQNSPSEYLIFENFVMGMPRPPNFRNLLHTMTLSKALFSFPITIIPQVYKIL